MRAASPPASVDDGRRGVGAEPAPGTRSGVVRAVGRRRVRVARQALEAGGLVYRRNGREMSLLEGATHRVVKEIFR